MSREYVVDKIVTNFLLNTCRLRPLPGKHVDEVLTSCAVLATNHPVNDANAVVIPLITGSVAEFYIEPMLPHVGDIDVMYHHSTQLAIPRGHPPPTQLPAVVDVRMSARKHVANVLLIYCRKAKAKAATSLEILPH